MRAIFLGTAASISNASSRLPAIALLLDDGSQIVFDTGEDIQRAFAEHGLKMNKHLSIFITHMHGDHIIGLPGLLFRMGLQSRTTEVEIFGPKGLFLYLLSQRMTIGLIPNYNINITEIDLDRNVLLKYPALEQKLDLEKEKWGMKKVEIKNGVIKSTKKYMVHAIKSEHTTMQAFSYIYKEHSYPGKFNPEKAKELNVPEGKLWSKLQQGHSVILKNGNKIHPREDGIVGEPRPGRVIIVSGDTRPAEQMKKTIKSYNKIDLLIHEATFLDELVDLAIEKKHTTVREACELAKLENVQKLALTHFSSRYSDEMERISEEANKYSKKVIVANDGTIIEL